MVMLLLFQVDISLSKITFKAVSNHFPEIRVRVQFSSDSLAKCDPKNVPNHTNTTISLENLDQTYI